MPENDKPLQVIVEKTHPDAVIPTKGSSEAACFDIYSIHNATIIPGSVTIVRTGIKMRIPTGYMIHIVPRSGLAFNNGIVVLGGIIDSDYRGEIMVMLSCVLEQKEIMGMTQMYFHNEYLLNKGARIAQLQVIPVPQVEMIEGKVNDDTDRSVGGFGSTGD